MNTEIGGKSRYLYKKVDLRIAIKNYNTVGISRILFVFGAA